MTRNILVAFVLVALSATCATAGLFPGETFHVGSVPRGIAVGDFDGDGWKDLVTANSGSDDVAVLLGHGDGSFASAVAYAAGVSPQSVAVGDFDGDGRQDLVTANSGRYPDYAEASVTVLLGHGNGTFAAAVSYSAGYSPRCVVVGDFDGDGHQDLVTANEFSDDVAVLRGNGDGTFAPALSYAVGDRPSSVAVGDFDGDGKQDLVTANIGRYPDYHGSVSVLLGHGDGTFAAAAGYAAGDIRSSVAVGDFDGDGKQDLVTNNPGRYPDFHDSVLVLLGNGDGTFTEAVGYAAGDGRYISSVAVGDFNGDGQQDLVTTIPTTGDVAVLSGNGDGTFAAAVRYIAAASGSMAAGDFDGDGRQDLVVVGGGGVTLLLGDGDETLAAATPHRTGVYPVSVAVGDFDGDGHQDLVTANESSDDVAVLMGNGNGTFAAAVFYVVGIQPTDEAGPVSVAVGDFDGDGHQDLVTATVIPFVGSEVRVLLGNGDGTFAEAVGYATGDARCTSVAVGDFDGDGHPDLVSTVGDTVAVLMGSGDGTFAAAVPYGVGPSGSVAVGDFNGDGQQDLVTAGIQFVAVLMGNGDGTFAAAVPYGVGTSGSVAVGDFNGDGQQDLVTAGGQFVAVLLGSGDGTFGTAVNYSAQAERVAVGDFDGDGRQDLVTSAVMLLRGNGDGTFAAPLRYVPRSQAVAVGDFDEDGQQDLVTSGLHAPASLDGLTNRVAVLLNQGVRVISVVLDIKPNGHPNAVNPYARGVIPVAILGSDTFDVAEIDVTTLAFGPNHATIVHRTGHREDVNRDGVTDLVVHFRTQDTGIVCGDESASLTGDTLDGKPIEGSDSIQTVGCRSRSSLDPARNE